MSFPLLSLNSNNLTARLASLRARTDKLMESLEQVISRADNVEAQLDARAEKNDHERRLIAVMELFMRDDVRACTVTDYVIVFFRLLLAKMRQRGHDFDDVRQLHNALKDDDNVVEAFRTTLSRLSFPPAEQRAVRVMLEAMQTRAWPTTQVMTTSPGGDAQISSALVYLRCQPNIDPALGAALQRALCAAHECVLTDLVLSTEALRDVNINANDPRKDEGACGGGGVVGGTGSDVKYRDYAEQGAAANTEAECSGGDGMGARGRTLALDGEGCCVPEPGAASRLAREVLLKHAPGARSPSGSSLRGASGGTPVDDCKGGDGGSGGTLGGGAVTAARKRSISYSGTDAEKAEMEAVSDAFTEACVISSEMAAVDGMLQGRGSGGGGTRAATQPPAPAGLQADAVGSAVDDSESFPCDRGLLPPDPNLYVLCFDAGTSMAVPEESAAPREPRCRSRPESAKSERRVSSVGIGTEGGH